MTSSKRRLKDDNLNSAEPERERERERQKIRNKRVLTAVVGLRGGLRGHGPTLLLDHMLTFAPIPGADPEILHGGWLSGWLLHST